MPTHDNQKAGKRIVSSAVAGILAVSMTPAIALAEEPAQIDEVPATTSSEQEAAGGGATETQFDAKAGDATVDTTETSEATADDSVNDAESEEASGETKDDATVDTTETSEATADDSVNDTESEEASGETDESVGDSEDDTVAGGTIEAESKLGARASILLQAASTEVYKLQETGVTVCSTGAKDTTFNVAEGQALLIEGTDDPNESVVFENCIFNLSGQTELFQSVAVASGLTYYYSGETRAKLCVGGNVVFKNCKFIGTDVTSLFVYNEKNDKWSSSGQDACISLHDGNISFVEGCEVIGTNVLGQFMSLYGSSMVTFDGSKISTIGNTGGWSYAMYDTGDPKTDTYKSPVLKLLNGTIMTAKGMKLHPGVDGIGSGGNVNAFYSGDLRTAYDAIFIDNSTIDFSDNIGGGFAINKVTINVTNGSTINVTDNAGNACNSGYWIVRDSDINMSGNKTHGWSCMGFNMVGGNLTVMHNGYAGIYIQSYDSFLNGTDVEVMCNGERYISYSAGDIWLNGHTLTLENCNDAWLGAIGRTGKLVANNCTKLIAYDLFNNKLKRNTETIIGEDVELGGQDEHYLFLNPVLRFDYARGDTEGGPGNSNDSDLFDQIVNTEEGVATIDRMQVIGPNAKIGSLTTAELSHHQYDWKNGEITDEASPDAYGVMRYSCFGACDDYESRTKEHPTSFDCLGTYVYAPLVGVAFDTVLPEGATGKVQGMPGAQTKIMYNGCAERPADPTLEGYVFTGWFADAECTIPVDFTEAYTNNWTVLYAGWEKAPEPVVPDEPDTPVVPDEQESVAPAAGSSTMVASYEVEQTQGSELPQSGDRSLQTVAVSLAALVAAAFTAVFAHRRRRS